MPRTAARSHGDPGRARACPRAHHTFSCSRTHGGKLTARADGHPTKPGAERHITGSNLHITRTRERASSCGERSAPFENGR